MIFILLYIIGTGTLLVNIYGTKTLALLGNADIYLDAITIENESVIRIGQTTTALFLIACTIGIVYGLVYRKQRWPIQGSLITIGWLLLYMPVILSALISENGGFSYKLLFFPLFMITVYLSPRFNPIQEIGKILPILLAFIYISLVAIFLYPTWAYASYSDSWIGIPIRLFGASSHPNGLGALAVSYLILARLNSKKSVWNHIHIAAAIITLVLSQSKTATSALLIWMIMKWVITTIPYRWQTTSRVLATATVFFLLIATYMLLFEQDFLISTFGYAINLTGRTDVWQVTLGIWLKKPLLGYGPNLWDLDFRQTYGYLWAGQAHNQFLQTLGESGLIGIFGLLLYFFILAKLGSISTKITNFASFGIIILILIRSFAEAPLRNYSLDDSFLINAIFFVILINSESLLIQSKKGITVRRKIFKVSDSLHSLKV